MSYYYLISGLPDLSLDYAIDNQGKHQIDTEELVDTIFRNLEPNDARSFRYLIYPNDNLNFLNILLQRYQDIPASRYIQPAMLDQQTVEEYQKNRSDLAVYMSDFLRDYEDQFPSMAPREMEDKLWQMYYNEAIPSDPFIGDYCRFERKMKQFFSAYNHSYHDFLKAPIFEDVRMAQVGAGKSLAGDLLRDFPYVEGIDEIVSCEDPIDIATFSDKVIWEYLDQTPGFFGKEQVFTYTIRLLIIDRWQTRNAEDGTARFIRLQEDIKNKVRSLKTAVI